MVFTFMSLCSHFLTNNLSRNLTALSADRKTIVTAKLGSFLWALGIRTPRCFTVFLPAIVFLLVFISVYNKVLMTGLFSPSLCSRTQTSCYQNVSLAYIAITVCSSNHPINILLRAQEKLDVGSEATPLGIFFYLQIKNN